MTDDSGTVDRRRFLLFSSGALAGGAALLAGCARGPSASAPQATQTQYSCECTEAHDYEWQDVSDVLASCPKCGESSGIICTFNPDNESEAPFDCHHSCPENPYSWTSSTNTTQCPLDRHHTSAECTLSS